jgi:hypothetical protein
MICELSLCSHLFTETCDGYRYAKYVQKFIDPNCRYIYVKYIQIFKHLNIPYRYANKQKQVYT